MIGSTRSIAVSYMAIVVGIVNGYGLVIDTCCGNYPNKSKLVLIHGMLKAAAVLE